MNSHQLLTKTATLYWPPDQKVAHDLRDGYDGDNLQTRTAAGQRLGKEGGSDGANRFISFLV